MQSPLLRSDLPVGAGAPVLREFDQNGVVEVGPRPRSPINARQPPALSPASPRSLTPRPSSPMDARTAPGSRGSSPAQRWQQAVLAQPLEQPRPLPGPLMGWARQISGLSAPRFTAGPATSAALGAVGALGASSGDVVHLQATPRRPDQVLAHELTHLRQPLTRPRFLMSGHDHSLDADERTVRSAVPGPVPGGPVSSAGLVGGLPVGGGMGGSGAAALAVPDPASTADLTQNAQQAVSGAADPWTSAAGQFGGAPEAAEHAVAAFSHGPAGIAPGISAQSGAPQGFPGLGPASQAPSPAAGPAGADQQPAASSGLTGDHAPGHTSGELSDHTVDLVVEAVEQRVLAELERRGGRYGGLF